MPKSRKNPPRKTTRCTSCIKGWVYRGSVPIRRCSKCGATGWLPEKR